MCVLVFRSKRLKNPTRGGLSIYYNFPEIPVFFGLPNWKIPGTNVNSEKVAPFSLLGRSEWITSFLSFVLISGFWPSAQQLQEQQIWRVHSKWVIVPVFMLLLLLSNSGNIPNT